MKPSRWPRRWVLRRNALLVAGVLATGGAATAQTLPSNAPLPDAQVPATRAVEPEPLESPGFGSLFKGTAADFVRLSSIETAVVLAIGGVSAGVGHRADRSLSETLLDSDGLEPWFGAGHFVGGPYFQLGGAFATYAVGRLIGSSRTATVGADLVRANLVSAAMTHAVKFSAHRTRPDGGSFSFPSGHTSSSFAAAAVLQRHLGWKVGVPAYTVATYVGVSRIQRQRHYLSDVAFGAAIGIVAGRAATLEVGRRRITVSPVAVPGGAGIGFSVE